jgi:hypothetical protein
VPRSVALAGFLALLGTVVFAGWNWNTSPPPGKQAYTSVAVEVFNFSALAIFMWILYRSEKKSAEDFGKVIRANISTIVVALLISLISSFIDVLGLFGVAITS